jgi:hypothetical protein
MSPWLAFLNTQIEDFAYDLSERRVAPDHMKDLEVLHGKYDDGSEQEAYEHIMQPCSALVNRPSPIRCSQLELSSMDSILLDFCKFNHM